MARDHICSLCNVDNPRAQAWMTTVSQFIVFRSKTDLVYRHGWLCRSGNGHGGSILTPQAENKNCQSVGTCSTWKMQSWLENTSVAFAMCIVQQSRSRYRLYVVRGRLHSTVCMARCGLRDTFVVWLCKSETIEDHVLYYAKVVSRCTCRQWAYMPQSLALLVTLSKTYSRLCIH